MNAIMQKNVGASIVTFVAVFAAVLVMSGISPVLAHAQESGDGGCCMYDTSTPDYSYYYDTSTPDYSNYYDTSTPDYSNYYDTSTPDYAYQWDDFDDFDEFDDYVYDKGVAYLERSYSSPI